jgi:hypothetical protein
VNKELKKISAGSIQPGMRLAKSILNEAGMTLFGEGTTLTEPFIGRIRSMDIAFVYVEGSSVPKRPLEEELSLLEARFKKSETEPYMTVIKTSLREYITSLYP